MKQRVISGVIIAALIVGAGVLGGYALAALIMVCSMIMLFRGGSLDKLIQGGYISQCERTGKYPATIREESVIHTAQLQGIAEGSEEEKDAGQPIETAVGMELVEKQIDAIEKNWKANGLPICLKLLSKLADAASPNFTS
jgi:hypothetical protein